MTDNENQILEMLKRNQEAIERAYDSVEKTRKYFLYSAIIAILAFLLPLIGLVLIVPSFISTYTGTLDSNF